MCGQSARSALLGRLQDFDPLGLGDLCFALVPTCWENRFTLLDGLGIEFGRTKAGSGANLGRMQLFCARFQGRLPDVQLLFDLFIKGVTPPPSIWPECLIWFMSSSEN